MAFYEVTFITRPDLSRADVNKLTDGFSAIVTAGKGKVAKTEYWGLRNLAYVINKNRKGHYVMLGIEADGDTVKELERNLGLNEDIMRHLTVRVEELEAGPTVMMRKDRDDFTPSDIEPISDAESAA